MRRADGALIVVARVDIFILFWRVRCQSICKWRSCPKRGDAREDRFSDALSARMVPASDGDAARRRDFSLSRCAATLASATVSAKCTPCERKSQGRWQPPPRGEKARRRGIFAFQTALVCEGVASPELFLGSRFLSSGRSLSESRQLPLVVASTPRCAHETIAARRPIPVQDLRVGGHWSLGWVRIR